MRQVSQRNPLRNLANLANFASRLLLSPNGTSLSARRETIYHQAEDNMPQRLRYAELAPQGIAILRQLEHYLNTGTTLSPVLLELLRLRVSTLNGCDYCIRCTLPNCSNTTSRRAASTLS